jgi:hypothetical protein
MSTPPPPSAEPPAAPGSPPPPPGPYLQQQRTNGLAVASLVLGILWIFWLGSLLALIFGFIAKRQIDGSGGAQTGSGLAIAGIVLGCVGAFTLLLVIVFGEVNFSATS